MSVRSSSLGAAWQIAPAVGIFANIARFLARLVAAIILASTSATAAGQAVSPTVAAGGSTSGEDPFFGGFRGGGSFSLAISSDGRLFGWGTDFNGNFGFGPFDPIVSPRQVDGTYRAVAAGSQHTVALTANGDLYAWGDNSYGQLGDGTGGIGSTRLRPTFIGSGYVAIAAGDLHTLALKANGDLYAWGSNFLGQLGDGTTADRSTPTLIGTGYRAIAAGWRHSVALKNNGDLYAWGSNVLGQLGDGTTANRLTPTFIGSGYQVIATGSFYTLAIKTNGDLYSWGDNRYNQLGDGTTTQRSSPVFIGADYQAVAAGDGHSVALKNNGDLYTWGGNVFAALVDPNPDPFLYNRPSPTLAGSGYQAIAAGGDHGLAIKTNGDLYSWGANRDGEVGDGTISDGFGSSAVFIGGGYQAVAAGGYHSLAIKTDGSLYAWGANSQGQLGLGISPIYIVPVLMGSGYQAVAAGDAHTVALKANGDLYGWGDNSLGQVGTGNITAPNDPRNLSPSLIGSGYVAISAGWHHTLAIKANGDLYAWGDNASGQLGDGTRIARAFPTLIGSGFRAVAAGSGGSHTVALKSNGDLYAWGSNYLGQLGDGTTTDRLAPTFVGSGYQSIAAGTAITFAIKANGDLYAWGSGALGDGASSHLTPTFIGSGYQVVSAGGTHVAAIKQNGALYTWGSNSAGEIGDGTILSRATPTFIGDGYVAAAAGAFHTLAVKHDGTVWAWGRNGDRQLGDGTFLSRTTPVVVLNENGTGSFQANDWFLNLVPTGSPTIPIGNVPGFLLVASANVNGGNIDLFAEARFRQQDVGKSIRVFAYTPASIAKLAVGKGTSCVLTQPTSNGMQQTAASNLGTISTVLNSQGQTLTILSNVSRSQAGGSCVCVGTGSGTEATDPTHSRCVASIPPGASGETCACPDSGSAPAANTPGAMSGLWWNSSESGWGIHFTQRGSNVFAAWYTYDTSGSPKWYVSTCAMNGGATGTTGICNGALYEVNGPTFFTPPFNTSLVHAANAGNLQVTFQDAGNASMTYSGVAGQARTVALTRQPLSAGPAPAIDYTDIWWGGASESGWGMAITQQSSTMFLAWYVYDNSAKPTWYVATCTLSGTTCAGSLLRTTGPNFGPTFNPSQVQSFTAGTVNVNFTDGNNATLNYTVNGVSGSKNITRQLF